MANNTESDATYCSDVEEVPCPIRRSKRLSQRNPPPSFRSNEDSTLQRLSEIYRTIKFGTLCSQWCIDDWQALQFELGLIKKTLKGRPNNKVSFISKKINENLQHSSSNYPKEIPIECENEESVKSPNILAGMMSEALTEIAPYQLQPNVIPTEQCQNSTSSIALTQKNPLDLTKNHNGVPVGPAKIPVEVGCSERNKQQLEKYRATIKKQVNKSIDPKSAVTIVDLTERYKANQENTDPKMKEKYAPTNIPFQINKYYNYLSTQERKIVDANNKTSNWCQYQPTLDKPRIIEAPKFTTTSTCKNNNAFKDSILKLYKDKPIPKASTSALNKAHTSNISIDPRKPNRLEKPKPLPARSRSNENLKQKSFRNTESIIRREPEPNRITPRNVQSEHFSNLSPDFLLDELLGTPDDNESVASLTPSMKEGFKKIFGTDNVKEFFGCSEEVYNLKESHVKRLAKSLNVEHKMLKNTIKQILSNDGCGLLEEDDIMRSDSSVIECSQSPPQRLFPSQRSQVSK